MTKVRNTVLLVGLLVTLLDAPASGFLINFDNLAPNQIIDGVDLGGLTISSAPGFTQVKANGAAGAGWSSPVNAITNYDAWGLLDGMTTQPLTITFAVVQSSISLTGGDDGGDVDQFTVTAFDINGNQIGLPFVTGPFGGNPITPPIMVDQFTVNLNFPGIKSVVVSNAINAGIGLDNIQFCDIPVPPTLLLLGSGLVGLLGLRRRAR
jgi:hypothetical protein